MFLSGGKNRAQNFSRRGVSPGIRDSLSEGNHDVGVLWLKELGVEIVDELEIGRWKLVHGHKLVEGENFIIGHEHPAIRLRDEVGAVIKVPAFLMGKHLIVLPAFSPWAYGNDVLREIVSPFLKYRREDFRVLVPVGRRFSTLELYQNFRKP